MEKPEKKTSFVLHVDDTAKTDPEVVFGESPWMPAAVVWLLAHRFDIDVEASRIEGAPVFRGEVTCGGKGYLVYVRRLARDGVWRASAHPSAGVLPGPGRADGTDVEECVRRATLMAAEWRVYAPAEGHEKVCGRVNSRRGRRKESK